MASGSQSFAGSWVKRLRALCLEPLDQLAPGHRPLPARQFGGRRQVRGSLSFADSYGYSLHRSKSESREQPEEKQKFGKQVSGKAEIGKVESRNTNSKQKTES